MRALRALPPSTRGIFFSRKENAPYGTPKKRHWCRLDSACNLLLPVVGCYRYLVLHRRPLSLPRCLSGCYANKLSLCRRNSASGDSRRKGIDNCPREAVNDCTQRQVRTKPFSFGCPEGYFLFGKRKYLFGIDGRRRSRRGRPLRQGARISPCWRFYEKHHNLYRRRV